MTVATAPASSATGISFAKEIELVKAALLYADEIELISLSAAGLNRVLKMAVLDEEGLIGLIEGMDSERDDGKSYLTSYNAWKKIATVDPAKFREFTGYDPNPEILRTAREFVEGTDKKLEETRLYVERALAETGTSSLEPVYRAGILKLSDSGLADGSSISDAFPDYLLLLRQVLQDPKSHLIFDDRVAMVVRSMVDEKLFQPHPLAVSHAGQAALGGGFAARLPTFSDAPIDELLDLRSDLDKQLSRYRRGIVKMADRLTYRAYDAEFEVEIDDLWRTEVKPALDEMTEGFAEHSLVRDIARVMSTDIKSIISASVGPSVMVGLDTLTHLGALISVIGGAAAPAATVATQIAQAHARRRTELGEMEKCDLFYLYDLNRRLETG
jgi:hypothetical protein